MFHPLSRRGLTLVEVLVVIFIIGVLLMLLWPSTCHVREAARRAYCLNTMMQMGLALHNYHDAHKCFPGSNDVRLLEKPSDSWADVPLHAPAQPDPSVGPAEYGTNFSWLAKITPYIEEGTFYQWLDMANRRAWDPCNDNPINPATGEPKDPAKPCHRMVWGAPIASFKCANFGEQRYCEANPAAGVTANPYDPKTPFGPAALTNYVALGATHSDSLLGVETNRLAGGKRHPNGTIYPGSKTSINDMTDGTTNTFIACETRETTLAAWYEGSTAAVVGLAGQPSFEKTSVVGANYGVPAAGTRTTLNYGDEESDPVTHYLPSGPQGVPWLHGPSSNHPGLVNHLLGDGSVRSVQDGLDPRLYMHLITRAGNEPINDTFEDN